jgi:hypothetical protein
MEYPLRSNIPYGEIGNGALILVLLKTNKTWDELCRRYAFADPANLMNTNTMMLRDKLFAMRELGLISFADEEAEGGKKPAGEIKETGLWSKIRVAFGGLSLTEVAMISQHSKGIAVTSVFGRPKQLDQKIDVFVLMPFNASLEKLYTHHLKKMGEEMGIVIRRADEIYSTDPFMEKVWAGICSAKLILADCTQQNPNVFYEIGIAHAVGKRVMLITRSENDIPADIKHFDYIPYVYDPEGTEQLIEKLRTFIASQIAPKSEP